MDLCIEKNHAIGCAEGLGERGKGNGFQYRRRPERSDGPNDEDTTTPALACALNASSSACRR